MAKQWRVALERGEKIQQERLRWKEEHPPITLLGVELADKQRRLTNVGPEAVTCDLPCHGNNIPKAYDQRGEWVDIFKRGITLDGWDKLAGDTPLYHGLTCKLTEGRICVATDERLREAVER